MSTFNLVVIEEDFSVPVKSYIFFKSYDIIFYASLNWRLKFHYEKLKHVFVMITWNRNASIDRKTSGLDQIM